jgi:hypothetical protein
LGVVSIELQKKPKHPLKVTNAILIVTNQGSLFTFEAMMNFDKIQQEESSQRLMCFSIDHPLFLIKTNGESRAL